MKILITGARGFVGQHLVRLLDSKYFLFGISRSKTKLEGLESQFALDLCNAEAVDNAIKTIAPDWIVHLAAQSHVGTSFRQPWDTLENNIKSTLNILESIRQTEIKLLLVSSSEVYGIFEPDELPITERHPPYPVSPYSVSKLTQEILVKQYAKSEGISFVIARPFNHIGPGQNTRFALPNFAEQIAKMEKGQVPPILKVGNLAAERDFSDVRDVVRAYQAIIEKGTLGETYNIGNGTSYQVAELVDLLIQKATIDISIEVEAARLRAIDIPRVVADASKLQLATDWQPQYTLPQTIEDILNAARVAVS